MRAPRTCGVTPVTTSAKNCIQNDAFSFGLSSTGSWARWPQRLCDQQAEERLGGRAEIAAAAMDGADGIDRAHRRHVETRQQPVAQLVAHAALGHQGEAEP